MGKSEEIYGEIVVLSEDFNSLDLNQCIGIWDDFSSELKTKILCIWNLSTCRVVAKEVN